MLQSRVFPLTDMYSDVGVDTRAADIEVYGEEGFLPVE
jgi:hypothetical protein